MVEILLIRVDQKDGQFARYCHTPLNLPILLVILVPFIKPIIRATFSSSYCHTTFYSPFSDGLFVPIM